MPDEADNNRFMIKTDRPAGRLIEAIPTAQPSPAAKPRLIGEDIEFLIYHRAALRFQHTAYESAFRQDGAIKGDAYSLSFLKEWYPANHAKAQEFQGALKFLVQSILYQEVVSRQNYDGVFLLFTGVQKAHDPVTDRLYGGPFYPVGASTTFTAAQNVGTVPLTSQLMRDHNCYGAQRFDPGPHFYDGIIKHLVEGLVDTIQTARLNATPETARLKQLHQENYEQTADFQKRRAMFFPR